MPDKFKLVAFCDVKPENALAYSQKYSQATAGVYSSHQRMFEKEALDLLVVCLPPFGHRDEVEVAARAGTHLLIEKPIALSSNEAWKMVRAAENAGIKTQVGFMFRFGAAVEALKAMIERGEAGPLGLMSARYFCNALHAPWWREKEKSGGQLVEQVIHMIDLMRYLMGSPATVYSIQNNLFHQQVPGYTAEDVSGTVMGFTNGGIGVIYATNGAIPGKWINDYRLVAKNLTAEFTDANHATFTFTGEPNLHLNTIASERDYYREELLDLYQAIRTGGETRTPLREGALSLDLALAAARSAENQQPVQLFNL
jgi:predicted dehydrogenase